MTLYVKKKDYKFSLKFKRVISLPHLHYYSHWCFGRPTSALSIHIFSYSEYTNYKSEYCYVYLNIICAGLGYGTQVIVTLLNFYYIIVLAWGIFYLSFSFSWDLPWSSCNNTWNTGNTTKLLECFLLECIFPLLIVQW